MARNWQKIHWYSPTPASQIPHKHAASKFQLVNGLKGKGSRWCVWHIVNSVSECIYTLPRRGSYQAIYPQHPKDFLRLWVSTSMRNPVWTLYCVLRLDGFLIFSLVRGLSPRFSDPHPRNFTQASEFTTIRSLGTERMVSKKQLVKPISPFWSGEN